MMHDVGIRDLRANLAGVLDRAARGERLRITERGRPKALLVPLPGHDQVAVGLREGWITRGPAAGTPLEPPTWPRPAPRLGMSTGAAIDEDRGA